MLTIKQDHCALMDQIITKISIIPSGGGGGGGGGEREAKFFPTRGIYNSPHPCYPMERREAVGSVCIDSLSICQRTRRKYTSGSGVSLTIRLLRVYLQVDITPEKPNSVLYISEVVISKF